MNLLRKILLSLTAFFLMTPLMHAIGPAVTDSDWHGYLRWDFVVEGRPALLIVPKTPAPGKPWIWRTEFFGAFAQADLALLERGWHVGYMNAKDLYGAPPAIALFDAYYQRVRKDYGLSARVVLEGFSRGGLYAFNYAATHPDRVAALYLDAPALDIHSWPGVKHPLWPECLASYGLTAEQAKTAKVSPLDRIEPVLKAKIPIFGVSGDADEAVPLKENLAVLAERYKAGGGVIEIVIKPGGKHHPHSLSDPTPIVNFLLSHAKF